MKYLLKKGTYIQLCVNNTDWSSSIDYGIPIQTTKDFIIDHSELRSINSAYNGIEKPRLLVEYQFKEPFPTYTSMQTGITYEIKAFLFKSSISLTDWRP